MSDIATMTDAAAFVRAQPVAPMPPPHRTSGAIGWLQQNLFSRPLDIALTLLCILLIVWIAPPLVKFLLIDAVWDGASRADCLPRPDRPEIGACWAFIFNRINFFTYGFYPIEERWRVDVFFALLAFGIGWMAWLDAPRRDIGAFYFFVVLPIASVVLLLGFPAIGLTPVSTSQWGGVLVTVVVAAVGIVASLPLGILLALGRRSALPIVRTACVVFIEFWRGVPLITVLFFATYMLPFFLPGNWKIDGLLRVLIGVVLFAGAYMAEVVRGGLQAMPRGQYEAATALGLGYWRTMGFIILPQALRLVIPGIVNSFIALFKDTTLVLIVAIFDLLGQLRAAFADPAWATPVTLFTGFAFAGMIYFLVSFGMSRYALSMERRLNTARPR